MVPENVAKDDMPSGAQRRGIPETGLQDHHSIRADTRPIVSRTSWLLIGTLVIVFAVFAAAVALRDSDEFSPMVDGVLGLLALWIPTGLAWWTGFRVNGRRWDILFSAGALSCWAVGTTCYVLQSAVGADILFPSPADVAYFGFYLLMSSALAFIVRNRLRTMTWPIVLDSAIGALGAAAVLGVVLGPFLESNFTGPRTLETVLGAGYPLMDLLLVATVIGMTATTGFSTGDGWILLVLGLITFTGADIAFAFAELNDSYVVGMPMDVGWAAGMALIAAWAVIQGRRPGSDNRRRVSLPAQAVPALATIAGLGVLILASQQRIGLPTVVLASLTLAFAALPLVFRQRLQLTHATRQARTDELTGLPNRRALYADVPARLSADGRRRSAVMLLDLDKFKEINDGLGHDLGDVLLVQVAARLSAQLRPADLLARMGGDEFVIHLDSCGQEEAQAVANNLRVALAEPYDLGGITIYINASIGIACYPEQGQDLALLLRKADMAMYSAKSTHSGHAVYADGAPGLTAHQFHTVQVLNEALVHDQLVLHFQPKVDLVTGDVRGVEALVRWEHPTLGLLQPDRFLKRFEEAGLLPALTDVVLTQALDQASVWADGALPLSVAVNLPASSIIDSRLPAQIASMTSARGLHPSVLVLEITEDALVADRTRAHQTLTALRDLGVRIAVDDFGKGYSSLSYLRELPIDELKLDKSFILTMMDDVRATALVVSTIDLAHSLGLEMTAEGVEDPKTYRALTDYGCDIAQGYFMSRPLSVKDFDTWLSNRTHLPGQDVVELAHTETTPSSTG
ncbi:putative bifunctional diguanylate cyclase/phosphodiesterase [Arthrobacter agilis]|uniref:putative bifunctional diguanylate cyclase/phosphodiesterase n=1 Tax=Arthrobacter agilis TaxID=37921 RepID=UPI002784EE92|nr:EAL domain-containing protein [Arthrobacter agilis]MDQ0734675.1 diguanylate cyclase (GGDEF)-like protein [Arthrobacter agilis]